MVHRVGSPLQEEEAELGCQDTWRGEMHGREHGVTWSAWRSKAKQGEGCGIGEQSPSLEHAAVGDPGMDQPARAGSLNSGSKMTLTQESSP